jgi:hypothetical protein
VTICDLVYFYTSFKLSEKHNKFYFIFLSVEQLTSPARTRQSRDNSPTMSELFCIAEEFNDNDNDNETANTGTMPATIRGPGINDDDA